MPSTNQMMNWLFGMDIRKNHETPCETNGNEPSGKNVARNKNGNGPRPRANAKAAPNVVELMVGHS